MTENNITANDDPKPKYWNLLNESDKEGYWQLRSALASPICKNRRNKSIQTFNDVINTIKAYVVRKDEGDLGRSLVCGIIWLEDGIAINTHQLRMIISKCKSSINGSFQALGYGTIPTGADSAGELIRKFPFMRNNFAELRQWTVRQKISKSQPPSKLSELITQNKPNQFISPAPEDKPTTNFMDFSIGYEDHVNFETLEQNQHDFTKESDFGYFDTKIGRAHV